MDMEHLLYRTFLEAELPAPKMLIEIPIGDDPDISRWVDDIFSSLRPRMEQHSLSIDGVGDLESLMTRLEAELVGTKTVPACIGLVGAWSQKPTSTRLL